MLTKKEEIKNSSGRKGKPQLNISAREDDEDSERNDPETSFSELITPLAHPSKRVTKASNLKKESNHVEATKISAKDFKIMKKTMSQSALSGPEFFGGNDVDGQPLSVDVQPPRTSGALTAGSDSDMEMFEKFKPQPKKERTKFPALQRKTASSSSALFGMVEVVANPMPVSEFKFNKSRRGGSK